MPRSAHSFGSLNCCLRQAVKIAAIVAFAFGSSPTALKGAEVTAVSDIHNDHAPGAGTESHYPQSERVAPATIGDLITWIESKTTYDASRTRADPPKVVFASAGDVVSYEGASLIVPRDVRALYDLQTRTIYLMRPWSEVSIADVSTLLHELVHDVQFSNRRWLCSNEAEPQAYRLQAEWLSEHGKTAHFNWVAIAILSKCFGPVHP